MPVRRLAAIALLVALVACLHPVSAVTSLFSGAAWIGMSLGQTHNSLTLAAGAAMLLMPLVGTLTLVAAVGLWRGSRAAAWLALIELLSLAVIALGPIRSAATITWLPAGRALALVVLVVALVLTLLSLRKGEAPGDSGFRLGRVAALVVACFFLVASALVLFAKPRVGLPDDPGSRFLAEFREGSAKPTAERVPSPEQNTRMARFPHAAIHNDADQTDTYLEAPRVDPRTGVIRTFAAGGTCASIMWDSKGRIVTVCVSDQVIAHILDPGTLQPLASLKISDRPITADFLTNFGGGGYAYLDDRDRIVAPTLNQSIVVIKQVEDGGVLRLERDAEFPLAGALKPAERPTSVLPDPSGRYWFVGGEGTIGFVEPTTGAVVHRSYDGQDIENSFAIGADGGVYVVTSEVLVRLRAAQGEVEEVWSVPYDRGDRRKPGQTSRASGTTPTIHGEGRWRGKLVSIADNADPMKINVHSVEDGSLICSVPIFDMTDGADENSLIALGNDLLAENNYGYSLLGVLGGHTSKPGAVRVQVDPDRRECRVMWTNLDVHIPSVVSKASAGGGVMITYTKDPRPTGIDAFWFTALDLATGERVWSRLAGSGIARNNHYAATYLGPDGGIYTGTIMGIVALMPG